MDTDLMMWSVGTVITIVGLLVGVFQKLAGRISSGDSDLHNRLDEVKEKYVRRDDLDGHIQRLESTMKDLRDETRENHKQLIAALTKNR